MATPIRTLGATLARRADTTPDRLAFTYSSDGETVADRVTYLELHRRAQAVAYRLLDAVSPGSHALLLFEPGLEFVAAVFGCFQAGVVGVSAPPPHPKRLHRTLPRLRALAGDARVDIVLTTAAIRDAAKPLFAPGQALSDVPWIAVDDEPPEGDPGIVACDPSQLAFMQYTSGSTTDPRGVMLTHANLLANAEVLGRGMRISSETRTFSWLPPSHDMGLVTGILQPVHFGYPAALMSPLTVTKQPVRWLKGVSRFGATISGAPNFAYELAVRRTTDEQRATLDLSCWEVAFNGAEPVRAQAIEAFGDAFAVSGFRRSSFYPCYGLAEATLMVTGPLTRREPTLIELDKRGLDDGIVARPTNGSRRATLVGCGEPAAGHEVAIVDRETLRRACPGEIGEIWVRGPSVAAGYWQHPQRTREAFAARIAGDGDGDAQEFLRTGDLGFLRHGELFIVGRINDVIVLHGRNLHPHDLEVSAESAHPCLRAHCSAAFEIELDGRGAAVAIVLEIDPTPEEELPDVIDKVRRQVLHDVDVQLERIALVSRGSVPKTTSGKIQRQLCRRNLAGGTYALHADWRLHRD
ncbi:MAG TPA: fatty acyl-AMP ligase [Solirubrobacteraceae bacterium]|jgi:acyl-CoA synthetase (AMP-forming)/AMP-acid ligase II|nr:fatty acyl-AMP ligase [Solirubrobacteraceae bacterium]